jgi:hypothetical protein
MLGILAGLKAGHAWLAAIPQIILVLVVTLPLTFLLGQCDGRRSEAARQDAARAAANVATIQKDGNAKETAANERLTDTVLVDQQHKELIDAIQQAPDSAPDASRVAFGCARLRAAGRSEASLPGVCRHAGGTQAGSH